MKLFYKYEFESEKQADAYIAELEKSDFKAVGVVKLGRLMTKPTKYRKDGKVSRKAVYSAKFSVDAIFDSIEPKNWTPYRIKLGTNPNSHNFAGVNYSE